MAKKDQDIKDIQCMRKALAQAKRAYDNDEVPIGSIVLDGDGVVVGRGHNAVEQKKVQTAHAEVIAITKACKKRGDWRLDDCTLYVTLEPCSMCMGLIRLSRIKRVVFGAESTLFGYRLDNYRVNRLYKDDVCDIREGVLHDESLEILKRFFKEKRKEASGRSKTTHKKRIEFNKKSSR